MEISIMLDKKLYIKLDKDSSLDAYKLVDFLNKELPDYIAIVDHNWITFDKKEGTK